MRRFTPSVPILEPIRMISRTMFPSILLALNIFSSCAVCAHGDAPWYGVQPLLWKNDQIDRVIAAYGNGRVLPLEGQSCILSKKLAFGVRDKVAFDIDETVWVDADFYDPP